MSDQLKIKVSKEQGEVPVTVFHIEGNIDGASYEELQTQATSACHAGTRHLLLDLTKVKYMSSAGLRALHKIYNMLNTNTNSERSRTKGVLDGSYKSPYLKLLNPSREVLQTLSVAGFDMFLEIHNNTKAAIKSY